MLLLGIKLLEDVEGHIFFAQGVYQNIFRAKLRDHPERRLLAITLHRAFFHVGAAPLAEDMHNLDGDNHGATPQS